LGVASLCRFPKKSGKNKGIHCRFACFASKKNKNKLHFFLLTNRSTKCQSGISGRRFPGFAVSGNNIGQLVPLWQVQRCWYRSWLGNNPATIGATGYYIAVFRKNVFRIR
tara:strand:- start:369 stop:698 length:330 start_codon:yes stop_codon:yes gene_type:complete